MEILLMIGIGVGLASVAGLRAFLPPALVGLFSLFGVFDLPAAFGFLLDPIVLAALFALALVESVLDKIAQMRRVSNFILTPVRVVSGAMLFAAATGAGLDASSAPELLAGGVIAGLVSVAKILLRPDSSVSAASAASSGSSAGVSPAFLSVFEDAVAVVGGIVALFVAFFPVAMVAFVLFFFYRIRKRRGRKYEGLRILGD